METGNHTLVKHLKTDPANTPLDPQDKAMIDFALKLTREPWTVKKDDVEFLQQSGFSEEQVVDIAELSRAPKGHRS